MERHSGRMDPDFKAFLDAYGIPTPEENLVDDYPPEPVDLEKLRAFRNRELDEPDTEWVAYLVSRFRSWYEADVRLTEEQERDRSRDSGDLK